MITKPRRSKISSVPGLVVQPSFEYWHPAQAWIADRNQHKTLDPKSLSRNGPATMDIDIMIYFCSIFKTQKTTFPPPSQDENSLSCVGT